MTDTRINLKIPPELHQKLKARAKKEKRTLIATLEILLSSPTTK